MLRGGVRIGNPLGSSPLRRDRRARRVADPLEQSRSEFVRVYRPDMGIKCSEP